MATSARRVWMLRTVAAVTALVALLLVLLFTVGWPASRHPTERAALGVPRSADAMEAVIDTPGPVLVETVVGADWQVDLSGLLDLSDPAAAGIADRLERIEVDFHALRHPTEGLFLIDTGVERAIFEDPDAAAIRGVVRDGAHIERMERRIDTAAWLAAHDATVAGVLLTHLHLDHVSGLRDVPASVPVYTGPGEASARGALMLATQGSTDRALEGRGPIRELPFEADASGRFAGVLDLFGDGSLWAILSPGHTPGSTAFLARTPDGPVLFTGDVCHTAFGWEHGVSPGTFTMDRAANRRSLAALRALVERHPTIDVRLGHQRLP